MSSDTVAVRPPPESLRTSFSGFAPGLTLTLTDRARRPSAAFAAVAPPLTLTVDGTDDASFSVKVRALRLRLAGAPVESSRGVTLVTLSLSFATPARRPDRAVSVSVRVPG